MLYVLAAINFVGSILFTAIFLSGRFAKSDALDDSADEDEADG